MGVFDRSRFWDEENDQSYYHLIVKVVENTPGNFEYAFDSSHKKKLEEMIWRLDGLYLMEVVSYCVMSNHVHIIMARNNKAHEEMSLKTAAERYQAYYKLKSKPDARSHEVRKFRKRINSISEFMRDLQRQFTYWYNNNQEKKRQGSLWNCRFKSVLLKSLKALSECMKYVELNPVRAKMSRNPASYAFSSWAHIVQNDDIGRLLRSRILKHLKYMIGQEAELMSDEEIFLNYAGDLESLGYEVAENKEVKRIDPYIREFLLSKCEHWTQLKAIGGEDILVGESNGRRRPTIVKFELC